jgi:hypothetical protein
MFDCDTQTVVLYLFQSMPEKIWVEDFFAKYCVMQT